MDRIASPGQDGGAAAYWCEGALFLLRVVQSEYGVQTVQQAPELDQIFMADGFSPERPAAAD